ncbi:MAG: tyrosine-type recombinase/integrase [Pseudomonadota bacterium]
MPKLKLSKSVVEKLQPGNREAIYWDEALPGFGVRLKVSGQRSYLVQYRERASGRSRRMTLGQHGPLMTFNQAKVMARTILADVLRGADPSREEAQQRAAPTMADLCADYIERHAIPNKRPSGVKDDKRMIDREILPRLGSRKVGAVTRRDIETFHMQFADRPYGANRLLSLLSKMFSLATAWGWRDNNPVRGIPRFAEQTRDRWLNHDELMRLWKVLEAHPNRRGAEAVQLQLLTGSRLGEVLTARRDDFDLERRIWTKPSAHTKQKRTEHLPLNAAAVALVQRRLDAANPGTDWLFPGNVDGEPLKQIKRFWTGVTEAAGLQGYRLHDNRHTYASHLVSDGLSLEIVGRLLGHTSPMTTKRYAHLSDDPLRDATEQFSKKIVL